MDTSESATTPPPAPAHSVPTIIAICCLAVITALTLGVGLATGLVFRHFVQTLPIWAAALLGFRRSSAAAWLAAPCFLFWLILMVVIWTFLLGLTHVISGTFKPIEIVMTVVVAIASTVGLSAWAQSRSTLSISAKLGLFMLIAVLQVACFRISFLPSIANR